MSYKIPGELTSAKELSDALHTPFDATARVLQVMSQKGLLHVEHGALGGYQILKDLSKISVLELMNMIEGPTAIVKCLHKEEPCEISNNCNIASPLTVLNNRLNDFYRELSLKELLLDNDNKKLDRLNQREAMHG